MLPSTIFRRPNLRFWQPLAGPPFSSAECQSTKYCEAASTPNCAVVRDPKHVAWLRILSRDDDEMRAPRVNAD